MEAVETGLPDQFGKAWQKTGKRLARPGGSDK
jgi:hypothetical protein